MQGFLESQPDLLYPVQWFVTLKTVPPLTHGHSRTPHLLKSPPRDNLLRPPVLVPPSCLLRSPAPRLPKYLLRTSTPTHLISFPLPVVPNQTQWKTALQITACRTIARPQLTLRQTQKVQPCSKQSPSCLRPKTRIDYPYPLQEFSTADPLKYPIWLRAFETLVESRAVNPAERLHFLGKYVAGEAKEVIEGFMLLDGEDAYQRAKEMLGKRYGDPFAVACAFRKKLEAWPVIAPYDSSGLRKYSDSSGAM